MSFQKGFFREVYEDGSMSEMLYFGELKCLREIDLKVGDLVRINPCAVVVLKNGDYTTVGQGARGKVRKISYNSVDDFIAVQVQVDGPGHAYWFYLDDVEKIDI